MSLTAAIVAAKSKISDWSSDVSSIEAVNSIVHSSCGETTAAMYHRLHALKLQTKAAAKEKGSRMYI
ncbi:unnamed protein product [Linum trigynum]|uniref:Uncharacterized protein n=1 Tax=Linum trigynum TaxID=586398 RepID=A0AAV2EVJ9_9ROSI